MFSSKNGNLTTLNRCVTLTGRCVCAEGQPSMASVLRKCYSHSFSSSSFEGPVAVGLEKCKQLVNVRFFHPTELNFT